jgi:DNA-binding response OmpR family regulator
VRAKMQATVPSLALLVEDDQLQRDFLSDVLKEQNFDVIECDNAEAAELIVARCGAELTLVVADFDLAGVATGADLAAQTREMFPYLPILVVSGEPREPLPHKVKFLKKPYVASDLVAAIQG